jgi:hypothetical protein
MHLPTGNFAMKEPTSEKSEIGNRKQIQKLKFQNSKLARGWLGNFEFPVFEFVWDFGFRISDFVLFVSLW